ncbi:hypothetical protein GGR57DRAFT_504680 [Xylariaceae sp. FL1272]|nr:hypothetical protein GGR57DRAFT_504680 [Xylariaceae sp. FL1272]
MDPECATARPKRERSDDDDNSNNNNEILYSRRARIPSQKSKLSLQQLQYLQKLIRFPGLFFITLPVDVQTLHSKITQFGEFRNGIAPGELSDNIKAVEGIDIPKSCFRRATEPAIIDPTITATFDALCKVVTKSQVSLSLRREEDAWYSLVYTPLFEMVFESSPLTLRPMEEAHLQQPSSSTEGISARFEPAMSAAIAHNSAPCWQQGYVASPTEESRLEDDPACLADYVIVLDMEKNTPLQQVIKKIFFPLAQDEPTRPYYIAQTGYNAIQESPIAVSTGVKETGAATDPLLQLALWTVAWYLRMRRVFLYRDNGIRKVQKRLADHPGKGLLPTLPLIVVVGADW